MEQNNLNWITGYIWGIADDVLRDLYVRGKYRDVILPMTVLRRFDAVLENSKQAVLDMKASLDNAGVVEQDQALRQAAGQAFYNTSSFNMRDLKARASLQQLIDATKWYQPLRKNLGKKNCELGDADIQRICDTFIAFEETEESKIFENADFGYLKVTVERPLRIKGIYPHRAYKPKEIKALKETGERGEYALPVIKKVHKGTALPDPLRGLFEITIQGKPTVVEYEPDTDLRDTEQIPMTEAGGIEAFIKREVLPYAPDAWYKAESVKIGYEISFTRYFYKPRPMRTLEEIRADILALEKETDGLLDEILGGMGE